MTCGLACMVLLTLSPELRATNVLGPPQFLLYVFLAEMQYLADIFAAAGLVRQGARLRGICPAARGDKPARERKLVLQSTCLFET